MERLEINISPKAREALERIAVCRDLMATTGKRTGKPALGRVVEVLAIEEAAKIDREPTLLAFSKAEPERAKALMLAALVLGDGNSESARAALAYSIQRSSPVSERDWRSARDLLGLGDEIRKRWPTRRGGANGPA